MDNLKKLKSSSRQYGFTLVEMLIALSIFAIISAASIAILSVVTQVQVHSSSSAVVDQESQFLLQKLQYYVQSASIIDIPTSTTGTSTLKFDVASSSLDPSFITLAGGTVYLQQNGSSPQPLTSDKVYVSNLSFIRNANPPGHDTVSISYTIADDATSSIAQAFSQFFQTSIEHVSAATFDSGVYPSSPGTEQLGSTGQAWSSVNGIINFNGSNNNVGIGSGDISPSQQLEVEGGLRLYPNGASQPTCSGTGAGVRGTLWFSTDPTNDSLYICANASGTMGWQQITL